MTAMLELSVVGNYEKVLTNLEWILVLRLYGQGYYSARVSEDTIIPSFFIKQQNRSKYNIEVKYCLALSSSGTPIVTVM
jgi:hypothetical protein